MKLSDRQLWLTFHRDDIATMLGLGSWIFAFIFLTIGYFGYPWAFIVFLIFLFIGPALPDYFRTSSTPTPIQAPPTFHGDTDDLLPTDQTPFSQLQEEALGQIDPSRYAGLEELIISEYQQLPPSLRGMIPIEIVDNDILFKPDTFGGIHIVTAVYQITRNVVVLYSQSILLSADRHHYDLSEYVRNILKHELGHAQGLTDKQMAERYGY